MHLDLAILPTFLATLTGFILAASRIIPRDRWNDIKALFSLSPIQVLVGMLVFSVPAASNGYIISRQMGGAATLYASILTWQPLICMVTLPLMVYAYS